MRYRTTKVERGTKPYNWSPDCTSIWQCTWFAFYSALEEGKTAPCYWDRPTKTGSYTDAKDWPENFREPWEVHKESGYQPVPGDRAIFDGTHGHVIVIIDNNNGLCTCTEYRSGNEDSFRVFTWEAGTAYTGALIGYLHWPYSDGPELVDRNTSIDQLQCSDDTVRIRDAASLDGNIVGHVITSEDKYYNVLSHVKADGYTWYEIGKGMFCANIGTTFLPAEEDIIRELEEYFKTLKKTINDKDTAIESYKQRMEQIHKLSE